MPNRFQSCVRSILTALLFASSLLFNVSLTVASGIPEVTFEATDFGFAGPDKIQSGWVAVRVVNKGKDLHHITLLRLESGKTAKDFTQAVASDPSYFVTKVPAWVKFSGGPNGIIPGESASAMVNLQPGNYVATCIIPDSHGVPHVRLGMVKPLTVVGPPGYNGPEPVATITITAREFNFSPDRAIVAGRQTIRYVNGGTEAHEMVLVQLPSGKTVGDFAAAFAPGHSGPPPGKPIGGFSGIEKNGYGFVTVDFSPGRYGLICFLPDMEENKPHFAMGMMYGFEVK